MAGTDRLRDSPLMVSLAVTVCVCSGNVVMRPFVVLLRLVSVMLLTVASMPLTLTVMSETVNW